jgi:hypothetical protein
MAHHRRYKHRLGTPRVSFSKRAIKLWAKSALAYMAFLEKRPGLKDYINRDFIPTEKAKHDPRS